MPASSRVVEGSIRWWPGRDRSRTRLAASTTDATSMGGRSSDTPAPNRAQGRFIERDLAAACASKLAAWGARHLPGAHKRVRVDREVECRKRRARRFGETRPLIAVVRRFDKKRQAAGVGSLDNRAGASFGSEGLDDMRLHSLGWHAPTVHQQQPVESAGQVQETVLHEALIASPEFAVHE